MLAPCSVKTAPLRLAIPKSRVVSTPWLIFTCQHDSQLNHYSARWVSLPSCHLSLIQCFYWTCCALLPPIHKLLIVNTNSLGGNFAFALVVMGQECFKLVLSPDTSYNKITIQSCSCRSSCAYLMVCWFPKRQILIPLPASPFFSSPPSRSWPHGPTTCLAPSPLLIRTSLLFFQLIHPAENHLLLAALVFCQVGKLNQFSEEPEEG